MAITLRDVTDADLPIFFDLQRDPTYNHMAAFTHKDPNDRADFDAHWKKILANPDNKNQTIVFEGQVAGHIASFPMGEDREITYGIARHLWGRGLATEALRAFLAVETDRPLRARAAKDNLGSLRSASSRSAASRSSARTSATQTRVLLRPLAIRCATSLRAGRRLVTLNQ